MQWYGDNSELNGIWSAELPDILLFGGIAIRKSSIPALKQVINCVKKRYAQDTHFPVKYNMRALDRWFIDHSQKHLYQKLLKESRDWRYRMIQDALACDFKIVLACNNMYGPSADRIRESKDMVARFCFSNALMRVALYVQESPATTCDVILDWPDANRHAIFTDEYRSAYTAGCCHDYPLNKYYSGPLCELGFSDSPFFTRTEDCALLQFSDLIVGAIREFIEYCLDKKPIDAFGVQLTRYLVPKFRGYPHRIIGRGISVSPPRGDLQRKLFKGMVELRKNE